MTTPDELSTAYHEVEEQFSSIFRLQDSWIFVYLDESSGLGHYRLREFPTFVAARSTKDRLISDQLAVRILPLEIVRSLRFSGGMRLSTVIETWKSLQIEQLSLPKE